MKKWIVIGGTVVIIIIVLLVVGVSNLGPMIKNAVNTYGPGMTKTEVSLGDVGISIFSGEAKLKDFYLGNPKGFRSPDAIKVERVYVDVEEGSLIGETVIIDKIEVVGPEITYEKGRGTDNFRTILNNIRSTVGTGDSSKQQTEKEGEAKKIVIRDFIVRDGKVNLAVSILAGNTISAPLPDIHLKDVGKKSNGLSPVKAFEEVFAALYKNVTSPAVTDTLNQGLKALGSSIETIGEGAKKRMKEVGEGAKKGLESVSKDAKKELEGVTDKVKGLFGD